MKRPVYPPLVYRCDSCGKESSKNNIHAYGWCPRGTMFGLLVILIPIVFVISMIFHR